MKRWLIWTDRGYVAGFSDEHLVVQRAAEPAGARRFATRLAAEQFIADHADAGYGLSRAECHIEEISQ